MKKFSFFAAALAVFFSFASCNLLSSDKISEMGRAEFSLSPELARAVIDSLQADEGESNPHMTQNLSIEVKLIGEYSAEKSLQIDVTELNIEQKSEDLKSKIEDKLTSQTIVIDSIPAGKRVSADVKVYLVSSHGDIQMKKDILVKGKSDPVTISAGDNLISVALSIVYRSYPVTFNLSFEKFGGDFTTCRSVDLYAVKADSDTVLNFFSTFAEGQGSSTDFYNILNGHLNPDCFAEAYWYKDSENKDIDQTAVTEDAMTLSGKIYLPFDEKIIFVALANFTGGGDGLYYICHVPGSSMAEVMSHAFVPDAGGNTVELKSNKLAVSTQYALYSYYGNGCSYWLVNNADYEVPQQAQIEAENTGNNFTFDDNGYFYIVNYASGSHSIKSNNPKITLDGLVVDNSIWRSEYKPFITVDRKTNVFYGGASEGSEFVVMKFSSLISAGDSSPVEKYDDTGNSTGNYLFLESAPFAVYNGKIYAICKYNDSTEEQYKLAIYNSNNSTEVSGSYSLPAAQLVSLNLSSLDFTNSAEFTDMIYQDDAVYMLFRNTNSGNGVVYSRGALFRYDIKKGTVSMLGFAPKTSLSNFSAVCTWTEAGSLLYKEKNETAYYTDTFSATCNLNAPYGNGLNSYFTGPEKFIAIKPKKLVISDNGTAFYTSSDIQYKRTVNRVVEIDLATLSMENAEKTNTEMWFNTDYPTLNLYGVSGFNTSVKGTCYRHTSDWYQMDSTTPLYPIFLNGDN